MPKTCGINHLGNLAIRGGMTVDIEGLVERMPTWEKRVVLHLSEVPKSAEQLRLEIAKERGKLYDRKDFGRFVNYLIIEGYVSRIERGKDLEPFVCLTEGPGRQLQERVRSIPGSNRPSSSPNFWPASTS